MPEYKFGVGTIRHEEGPPPPPGEEEEESGPPKVPDAYEFRLLLAEDFGDHVEWAMNWFFEKENTGDRGREWGFAQSASIPILLEQRTTKGRCSKWSIRISPSKIREAIRCIVLSLGQPFLTAPAKALALTFQHYLDVPMTRRGPGVR